MSNKLQSTQPIAADEFSITRVVHAARTLVYKAFTEPEHLLHWWGPKGFALSILKFDLRPDGVFHYGMRAANGMEMWGRFTYREIVEPERIVFVLCFADPQGNPARSPFSEDWPMETLNTWTFTEQDGATTLHLRARPINASEIERKAFMDGFGSMQHGFGSTFDQLDVYLAQL